IAALLGTLKAGAAYVPIDPADPPARASLVLTDADVTAVISNDSLTVEPRKATDDRVDAAYLMYTSGSTGPPQAVVVGHSSILNLVPDMSYVDVTPGDTLLQLAPAAFDASTFEIWGSLLNGARLVLPPPGAILSQTLDEQIRDHAVQALWLTIGLF